MDNKKCLMINGAIERKDGKEIDINNFVDKFVNFIEEEGYFYGGSFEYDKKLEEKKLSEYTKSEMLDLENRVENLIKECNKENQIIVGYKLDKEYDDLIILRDIKKGKTYPIFSILEKQLNKYPYLNDNEACKIKVINLNNYFGGDYIEIIIKNINPKENINIIVDNLIFYGSPKASNRFYIYKYDNQTKKPIFEKVCSKNNNNYDFKRITELTCDYLRRSDDFDCCNSVVKRMIKNGINL